MLLIVVGQLQQAISDVWNVIGVIGILIVGFIPFLMCIRAPLFWVPAIAWFVSWLFAAKEALDLDWVPTIITVIIGWVVGLVVTIIERVIIGILGIAAAVAGGMIGEMTG